MGNQPQGPSQPEPPQRIVSQNFQSRAATEHDIRSGVNPNQQLQPGNPYSHPNLPPSMGHTYPNPQAGMHPFRPQLPFPAQQTNPLPRPSQLPPSPHTSAGNLTNIRSTSQGAPMPSAGQMSNSGGMSQSVSQSGRPAYQSQPGQQFNAQMSGVGLSNAYSPNPYPHLLQSANHQLTHQQPQGANQFSAQPLQQPPTPLLRSQPSPQGYPAMGSSTLTYAVPQGQQRERAMSSISSMLTSNGPTTLNNNNNANICNALSGHAQRRHEERVRMQKELEHLLEELELTHVLRQPLADYGVESCQDVLLLDEDEKRRSEFFAMVAMQCGGVSECGGLPFKPMQWKALVVRAREKKELSIARCPNSFICPITQEIMVDPVIVIESGMVYERAAIEAWFQQHDTDPMTNCALKSKAVLGILAFKQSIEEWKEINNVV